MDVEVGSADWWLYCCFVDFFWIARRLLQMHTPTLPSQPRTEQNPKILKPFAWRLSRGTPRRSTNSG